MRLFQLSLLATAMLVSTPAAWGAELTFLERSFSAHAQKPVGAVVLLQGDIVEGDAMRLATLLSQLEDYEGGFQEAGVRLILNSPGGNYAEGLRIGRLVREKGIGTTVPAGVHCYSACAIAFMHGTVHLDGEKWLNRKLDPGGRLGFHAPYLDLPPDMETTPETVATAYAAALYAISDLIESAQTIFSEELLMKMLRVPPDEMLLVETHGDLFAWDIELDQPAPPPVTSLTKAQMVLACETIDDVNHNRRPDMTTEQATELANSDYAEPRLIGTVNGDEIYRYPVNDMNEIGCNIGVSKQADGSLRIRYYGNSYGNIWGDSPLPERHEWTIGYRYLVPPGESFLK